MSAPAAETAYPQLCLNRQLCFPLYAAARKIVNLYTPLLKPLGLTYTQYIVLLVLWEEDGVSVGQLSARLKLDSGTLTPLLKKLESAGLLTRERSHEDERVVTLHLTDAGYELQHEAAGIPEQMAACVNLSESEAATLYGLLYKLLD